jgi:hypothetical protein
LNLRLPPNVRNGNLSLSVRFGLQASPAGGFLRVAGGADRDPRIVVAPTRIEFGDVVVGESRERQLTIANSGTAALTVREFGLGLPVFSVSPSLGFRLEPGQQRIVQVRLTASAIGPLDSTLTIRSDDTANPNLAVPLSANVTGQLPTPNPTPVLTSLSPDSIDSAGAAFNLVVNGRDFVRASVVEWNGQARSTFFNHSAQLIAFVTAQDILAAGSATVTVTTPAPGGGRSNGLTFTIRAAQVEGPLVLINQFDPQACPDVTSWVSVLDAAGLPIGGLNSTNLSCTVEGQPVQCTSEPETEAPLSVVLIPGLNGLTRDEDIALMRNAVRSFVTGLPDNTRISLIHLEDVARPLAAFTEDKDRITTLVDMLRPVPPGNALFDAVTLAVTQARNERGRRVAVVLISALDNLSGNERGPTSPLGNARILGLPFFTFAIGPGSTNVNLTGFLRELSRNTGGQLVTQAAPLEYGRMMRTMNQILTGQYRVRHFGLALDSQTRTFRVTFQTPFGTATGSRTYACAP